MQPLTVPAQKVALHTLAGRPVENGLVDRLPAGRAGAVEHQEIGHGLADVVQQTHDGGGQLPARFEHPALLWLAVEGKQPSAAGPRGLKRHLETMTKQPAGAAMMMGLGGRQQMHERGIAFDERTHQGLVVVIGHRQRVLQRGDQLRLRGQQLRGTGHRQSLQERRIARNVGLGHTGREDRRSRGGIGAGFTGTKRTPGQTAAVQKGRHGDRAAV